MRIIQSCPDKRAQLHYKQLANIDGHPGKDAQVYNIEMISNVSCRRKSRQWPVRGQSQEVERLLECSLRPLMNPPALALGANCTEMHRPSQDHKKKLHCLTLSNFRASEVLFE